MGRYIDLIFSIIIGIVGLLIVRFYFKDPALLLLSIIILFLFAISFLDFLSNSIQSDNIFFVKVFDVLLVACLVLFVIVPTFSESGIDDQEESTITTPIMTKNPQSRSVQTTTTPVEYYTRSFHWNYGSHSPTYVMKIPKSLYQYYRNQPHDRNYVKYAISAKDRPLLDEIISDFRDNTDSKTEAAHNVVAFVQSIPYSTDHVSTGFNEYPRYPVETLVDGRGDCEDTAILTAALLKEMNYDVILLSPPGHMAVGITCPACTGSSITVDGKKYYYLETTGNNWKVGQLPPEYKNDQVKYCRI